MTRENHDISIDFEKLDDRKQKEIEHSDRRRQIVTGYEYQTDTAEEQEETNFVSDHDEFKDHFSNMKFYSITRSSMAYRDEMLLDGIHGCTVLDYCCGNGEVCIDMVEKGAKKAYGIDISQVAVENATKLAQAKGVEKQCEFKVTDAENMAYEGNTFDIVHEYGALHHLELDAALKELARVLKPEGKVVCTETLRHNPIIYKYRRKTPHLRTKWEVEHILGVPEIMMGYKYFEQVNVRFFHLAALGGVPFRRSFIFRPLLTFLEGIDNVLLRIPYLKYMAWIAVVVYTKPRKA